MPTLLLESLRLLVSIEYERAPFILKIFFYGHPKDYQGVFYALCNDPNP